MAEVSERRDREVAPLVSVETVGKILARRLLALNLLLAGLAVFSSIRIGHALFDPNRSSPRSSEATAPIQLPAPTLTLYGVAISDDTRVAFVQDLVTKQIVGYKTGDRLAGGQVERIEPDRVVIMRADGPMEVLLHQPKEHQPEESQAVVPSAEEVSPRRSRGR